jgi:hypothetical protein
MQWTDAIDDQVAELKEQGYSWANIGEQVGCTANAARTRHLEVRKKVPVVSRSDLQEMRRAARGEPCVSEYQDDSDIAKKWLAMEEDSERRIAKAKTESRFFKKLPSDRVSAITIVSDQHIAPGTPVAHKRMRLDAELIRDTKDVHVILGGDGVDNHIKHSSAILAARSQPSDQYEFYDYYLELLKERILVVTSGNHDLWSNQVAGIDMVKWICKSKKLCYAPHEARITLKAGKQEYKVAVRHQYRMNSGFNQCHCVKQWLRNGEELFDIGAVGHHHEAAIESADMFGQQRWFCRPGSYQITSAYSSQYGWNMAVPTCPTFLVFPTERKILGFANISEIPRQLKNYNG